MVLLPDKLLTSNLLHVWLLFRVRYFQITELIAVRELH
jgi:hypothetical protein